MSRPEVLDRVLASQQDLDMPEPSNIIRFFTVLWESLYPDQNFSTLDLNSIEERNDDMEINFVLTT